MFKKVKFSLYTITIGTILVTMVLFTYLVIAIGYYAFTASFTKEYNNSVYRIGVYAQSLLYPDSLEEYLAIGAERMDLAIEEFNDFGIPIARFRGAFIPLNTVQSTVENVILIGDAGGFPNKLTGEGLYDAFKTAYNAKRAIVENIPFSETNRGVFEKMKKEEKVFKFFFSNTGFKLIRWGMRHPRIIKWLFDAKMKRETFVNK